MIRAFTAATGGALLIVGAAYLWLVLTPLAHAAAPCAGTPAVASYYGRESGSRTATGEYFDGSSLTAASLTLPFGTRLRVSFNGRSVVVRINDRGPAPWTHRDIDLSEAAARQIGLIGPGHARVCLERLS